MLRPPTICYFLAYLLYLPTCLIYLTFCLPTHMQTYLHAYLPNELGSHISNYYLPIYSFTECLPSYLQMSTICFPIHFQTYLPAYLLPTYSQVPNKRPPFINFKERDFFYKLLISFPLFVSTIYAQFS